MKNSLTCLFLSFPWSFAPSVQRQALKNKRGDPMKPLHPAASSSPAEPPDLRRAASRTSSAASRPVSSSSSFQHKKSDPSIPQPQAPKNKRRTPATPYAGVGRLCEEMDVYIDIMNSTSESACKESKPGLHHQSNSQESAASQERLLGVLRFFTAWKKSTADNPDQFIPQQSYEDLCWSINGNVSLIEYYTTMFPTFKWRLKCVSTDCCENHFTNTRQYGASGSNPTAVNCLKASEQGNTISGMHAVGIELRYQKSNNAA